MIYLRAMASIAFCMFTGFLSMPTCSIMIYLHTWLGDGDVWGKWLQILHTWQTANYSQVEEDIAKTKHRQNFPGFI